MKKTTAKTETAVIPREIKILQPEEMPLECQRAVLQLFDQLVARGVSPEKAAYTTSTTLYGRFFSSFFEHATK